MYNNITSIYIMNINTKVVNENDRCGIINNNLQICDDKTFCSKGECKRIVESRKDINLRICSEKIPLNRTWTLSGVHHVNNIGWVSDKHNCFQDKIQCESNVFNDKLSYNSKNSIIEPQVRCWVNRHDSAGNSHRHYLNIN